MNRAIFLKTAVAIVICIGLGVAAGIAVAAPDDSVITAKIKSALVADRSVNGFGINVETRSGEVLLSGTADNQAQIDRVVTIARQVDGVRKVDNRMRVTR
jgi:osmotically-inducible protein OsmY